MHQLTKKDNPQHVMRFLALLGAAVLLFLLLVPAGPGRAALSDLEKKELYAQGTEYFQEAIETGRTDPAAARDLFTKSLLRFERLAGEGEVKNGRLFYNIANIHLLLDDVGRAILNYRRAAEYIPNDTNLAKNLAYARSMRSDRIDVQEREKILHTLLFFHYDLPSQSRLVFFGAAYLAFWLFAGIRIFSRRPFTSWGLGVTLLFTLLFGISLFVEARSAGMKREGVILAGEVTGFQGDATSYQPSFEEPLHSGTEFRLLEERGAWWQIELADGRTTWIPAGSAEMVRGKRR
jgi:tetratricopeptide (TPR) repeat protein